MTVNIFHSLADSHYSSGLIGKQLTSIILPRDRNIAVESSYHSNVVKSEIYIPDQVYIMSKNLHLNVENVRVEPVFPKDAPPLVGPKLLPNEPCWCKSGEKYKYCHGQKSKLKSKIQIVATPDKEE